MGSGSAAQAGFSKERQTREAGRPVGRRAAHRAVVAEEALDVGRNLLPALGRSVGGEPGAFQGVSDPSVVQLRTYSPRPGGGLSTDFLPSSTMPSRISSSVVRRPALPTESRTQRSNSLMPA
jgi:hypothetical protein